jgi:hypothetical protein
MKENKNIFYNKPELPVCLQQAEYFEIKRYVYGVPINFLKTNEHRIISYFKPISKLFI